MAPGKKGFSVFNHGSSLHRSGRAGGKGDLLNYIIAIKYSLGRRDRNVYPSLLIVISAEIPEHTYDFEQHSVYCDVFAHCYCVCSLEQGCFDFFANDSDLPEIADVDIIYKTALYHLNFFDITVIGMTR